MTSIRSLSSLTICWCILMSVCPLGSTASASTSMWGKMLKFDSHFQRLCQLQPEAEVPALRELSACVLVRRTLSTRWTAFVYKAPRNSQIELGLQGKGPHLTVGLFGQEWQVEKELRLNEWHTVCLTWSAHARRLRIYINGTILKEMPPNEMSPPLLSQNGTLTLGASHYVQANGEVKLETGSNLIGEIGLFRIWSKEWSAEELGRLRCADGDVVSWDLRNWKNDCPLVPEKSLHCAWSPYKIKMWTFVVHSAHPENCSVPLEKITADWLKSIFPTNVSVLEIIVSFPSRTCPVVNNFAAQHAQQTQGLGPNSTCNLCYHCEVHINVEPAANVEVVQADITTLLNLNISNNFLNLTVDPSSVSVLPLALHPVVTTLLPTVSPAVTTSETGPTQSPPERPANTSTTREPLDINETSVGPDTFFRVNLTLSMSGNPPKPKDVIEKWVKEQLEGNKTMVVLNFVIKKNGGSNTKQNDGLMSSGRQQKQYVTIKKDYTEIYLPLYYCTFHVQEYRMNSVAEIEAFINVSLTSKYESGSIVIQTTKMAIKHIAPANCKEETVLSIRYGVYIWPETFPEVTQAMGCQKPISAKAHRLCKLDPETDQTSWANPDMKNCKRLVAITDLDNITVTTDNVAEVVDIIRDLVQVQLNDSEELSSSQLDSVMDKLSEVVDISIVKPAVGVNIISTVSNILLSKTDLTRVSNNILNLTEKMGDNMDFQNETLSLTAPSVALSMINVDPDQFGGLTFGVSSVSPETNPEVFVSQSFVIEPVPETNATISLPSSIRDFFPPQLRNTTRVQFQFYATDDLFQDQFIANGTHSNWILNSHIVAASIRSSRVINLEDQVVVTLSHLTPAQPDTVRCMFWDFDKNAGQGGWNSSGCQTQSISPYQTSCLCDHLTQFAVLLDLSRAPISETDSFILKLLSFVGCGISSIFLGITLLTYLVFEKLRRDYPSKILINLSAALLGLSMIFLLDSWLSSFSNYGLCISTAAALHYFLLASFTWMGLEAVHMYLALVKVFNTYVPSYILKFCAVGWGVPLVIVSLVLAVDKDVYGSIGPDESGELFCWLQSDIFFYVTVAAFVLLILLCNMCVFIVVLIQIRQMKVNKPSAKTRGTMHHLRAVASLTVLLGLTWPLGLFSFGPGRVVLMYLFTIFNTLQGFFVFVFHCLMKENVRKQWRIHLCCGRFRGSEYTDWSRSATVDSPNKKKNLVNSESVASDNTSSSTGQHPSVISRGH